MHFISQGTISARQSGTRNRSRDSSETTGISLDLTSYTYGFSPSPTPNTMDYQDYDISASGTALDYENCTSSRGLRSAGIGPSGHWQSDSSRKSQSNDPDSRDREAARIAAELDAQQGIDNTWSMDAVLEVCTTCGLNKSDLKSNDIGREGKLWGNAWRKLRPRKLWRSTIRPYQECQCRNDGNEYEEQVNISSGQHMGWYMVREEAANILKTETKEDREPGTGQEQHITNQYVHHGY